MRGGSLDIIAGKTVNPDSLLPDHSFIGIGGNAVIWNDDKFLAPSVAQSVEAEFAWEVGTLDWHEDTTKSVFNGLSGTLQAAFVGLNYARNIGAHSMGGISKPFNIHKNSPINNLNSEFKLSQSLSERGMSFNRWLNERYKFERRE
jgi:hypothetical protein